jgi:hypothetical protein
MLEPTNIMEHEMVEASVKETYYWPIIQRLALTTGPAPKAPGRKPRITRQEKDTARRLVIALGYGHSSIGGPERT